MPTDISEKELETILVSYLRDHQGYEEGVSSDYNKEFGLDTERVKRFILSTQKEKVENTACFTSPTEEHKFFSRLSAALSKRGVTDVLRKGFKYISEISLAISGDNPFSLAYSLKISKPLSVS